VQVTWINETINWQDLKFWFFRSSHLEEGGDKQGETCLSADLLPDIGSPAIVEGNSTSLEKRARATADK
jgi:hypothetical protein